MTYKQAYDKIIEAYFKDEIKPFNAHFCFCGTLSPNCNWSGKSLTYPRLEYYPYSIDEYSKMEQALFSTFPGVHYKSAGFVKYKGQPEEYIKNLSNYEDVLFAGMCAALEVLKQIHKDRGEDVDETLSLTKRTLISCSQN